MKKTHKKRECMKSLKVLLLLAIALLPSTFAFAQNSYNIAIIQLIENSAFTDMSDGFIARMREKGYDESRMKFTVKSAQGDSSNLNSICQEAVTTGYDFVVAIATPAAQAMVNMESDIPVFFISVANPLGARIISDMQKPDMNATGTSNAIPIKQIFDLAADLTPEVKSYGMLYTTGEINAVTTIELAKAHLDSLNIPYVEAVVTSSAEVQQAAQSLVGKVDAFFIPNDSVIQSAMTLVGEVTREAKLPSYCCSTTTVQAGGLATVAISDIEIGAVTADMAIEYLNGKKIEEIPAQVVPATDVVISKTTAEVLGLDYSNVENVIVVEDN